MSRVETNWTRPLQLAAAAFFALAGCVTLLSLLATAGSMRSRLADQYTRLGMPADQVQSMVNLVLPVTLGLSAGLAGVYLLMAFGSYRKWTWAFWVGLVLLGLNALGLSGARALADPSQSLLPALWIGVSLLEALLAVPLGIWFVAAALRYGPWARTKAA